MNAHALFNNTLHFLTTLLLGLPGMVMGRVGGRQGISRRHLNRKAKGSIPAVKSTLRQADFPTATVYCSTQGVTAQANTNAGRENLGHMVDGRGSVGSCVQSHPKLPPEVLLLM